LGAFRIRYISAFLLAFLVALPATGAANSQSSFKNHSASSKARSNKKSRKGSWKRHGQQQILEERVREIQGALIRQHYMDGKPTGVWDQHTKNALAKLQGDQGWQTKVVPDSRALIKLGLGPNHEGALNAEAAADKSTAALRSPDPLTGSQQK
jgi:Putative peptidoglycan binding domain